MTILLGVLERKLHKLVCAGQLDLKTAQRDIASNWIEAYKKYVDETPHVPVVREKRTASGEFGKKSGLGQHALWQILETRLKVLRQN
jgi:hypothetical protein